MMKKKPETAEKHDKAVDSEKQPLLYHLMGLRTLLMHCGVAILIGFIATFYFLCEPLMNLPLIYSSYVHFVVPFFFLPFYYSLSL